MAHAVNTTLSTELGAASKWRALRMGALMSDLVNALNMIENHYAESYDPAEHTAREAERVETLRAFDRAMQRVEFRFGNLVADALNDHDDASEVGDVED